MPAGSGLARTRSRCPQHQLPTPSRPPHPRCSHGRGSYGTCGTAPSPAAPGAASPPCSPMAPGRHPRPGTLAQEGLGTRLAPPAWPAAHGQEVAAEVEGRLFMLFFLYKSGWGWTIADRTSCVCCVLITGAATRTNTAAPRPERERARGAAGRHPHAVPTQNSHGALKRRGRSYTSLGTWEGAACPGWPPAPQARSKTAAAPILPPHWSGTFRQPPPLVPRWRGWLGVGGGAQAWQGWWPSSQEGAVSTLGTSGACSGVFETS